MGVNEIILATGIFIPVEGWDWAFTVFISIGFLASVTLLTVALFSHAGEPHLSPMREAALATGHDDRKTIFENPSLRAVLWILLNVAHRLNMPRLKLWVERTLVASGNPSFYTPEEYLAMAMFTGLSLGTAMEVVHLLILSEFSFMVLMAGFLCGGFLTLAQLYSTAQKRLRVITKRIPYALDLISLSMGAGATFTEAVRTVGQEDPDDPFNVELNPLLAEIDLGTTRRKAMQNLAGRVPVASLQSVVASVVQAEELGTPLSDVLKAQATLMRLERSSRAEEAAAVAAVRMLVPSLLLMFAVMLVIFAPAIIRIVKNGGFF